ncbi:MAG TPA: hypothetical protein PLJ21_12500 [Pseudobdellovibrionaceae bacterium]|nr:hypothetical protein [Pseudobdellovibrionaceae bacterium]
MKSFILTINYLLFMFLSMSSFADTFFQSDFMKPTQAEQKWGIKPFDKDLFRTGDHAKRESMAVDIITKNLYVGKPMKLVRQELGDPDSYFFSDTIYAYKIMPFPGENKEIWHLIFIPDKNLEKVKEVKIHKKCCYKLPF